MCGPTASGQPEANHTYNQTGTRCALIRDRVQSHRLLKAISLDITRALLVFGTRASRAGHGTPRVYPVFQISRDRSRSRIKSCNPKNQIWDLSRNKWYLSQSGSGIKSGISTTFFPARNCGSALTAQPRRTTTEPGVLGAWTILRDIGTSARTRRVVESTP